MKDSFKKDCLMEKELSLIKKVRVITASGLWELTVTCFDLSIIYLQTNIFYDNKKTMNKYE